MPLINVRHIAELAQHTHHYKFVYDGWMLGWEERDERISDAYVVKTIRLGKQADYLFDGLRKLHQVCFDLAAGNLLPYQQEHDRFNPEGDAYDPFDTLLFCFGSDCVRDLPNTIEQYRELVELAAHYESIKKRERQGLGEFFGSMTKHYLLTDKTGQQVIIPENELPDGYLERLEAVEAIEDINVEYCLDGYNQFVSTCVQTILDGKPSADIVGCAQKLLNLFAPYPAELTPPEPR